MVSNLHLLISFLGSGYLLISEVIMYHWSDNKILGAAAGWLLAVAPLAAFMLFMKVGYILTNLM